MDVEPSLYSNLLLTSLWWLDLLTLGESKTLQNCHVSVPQSYIIKSPSSLFCGFVYLGVFKKKTQENKILPEKGYSRAVNLRIPCSEKAERGKITSGVCVCMFSDTEES